MWENFSESYEDVHPSEEKTKQVLRITWVGLFANVFLSAVKFAGGILGHSQAVVADAVHSLSDCVTDLAILIGARYWSKPPDESHPYGHHRIETIVTIFIGVVLLFAAVGLGWNAIVSIQEKHAEPPSLPALLAAILSLAVKESLYWWTVITGRKTGSRALVANAWHHRLDGFSSIPVILAVVGSMLMPEWTVLDHVGAIIVAVLILQAAFRIVWPGLKELTDVSASPDKCDEIEKLAMENKAVRQVHGMRTRRLGGRIIVDMHIILDGSISLREGHDISEAVKKHVLDSCDDVLDVTIHIEPPEEAL